MAKKIKIEINSSDNLKEILQEAFDLADSQIIQAQNEINKLSSATKLNEEVIDGKVKYAKAINDYLGIKDKAISKKIEIAKLMSELMKHNGDGVREMDTSFGSFNFDNIRAMIDGENDKTETIKLNK